MRFINQNAPKANKNRLHEQNEAEISSYVSNLEPLRRLLLQKSNNITQRAEADTVAVLKGANRQRAVLLSLFALNG
jgi:hypothetical protein